MFCPRCAAQNLDDVKFCRACGTNLETVALALADKYQPTTGDGNAGRGFEGWRETRKDAVNKLGKGIGLFVSSVLIGVALGLFSSAHDWIIIWMGLVGWMTCWGTILIVSGTAGLMESRFMRRQLAERSGNPTGSHPAAASLPERDLLMMNEASTAPIVYPQSSVTEHTTTQLIKPDRTS